MRPHRDPCYARAQEIADVYYDLVGRRIRAVDLQTGLARSGFTVTEDEAEDMAAMAEKETR